MYNLTGYSKNYRKTTGSLWYYYRDEPNSNNAEKDNVKIVVPLKYLSGFGFESSFSQLDIPLINCEVSLDLAWSENCELTSKVTRDADPDADPAVAAINNPTNAFFKITEHKLYIPVVTLSNENEIKLLERLKKVFKISFPWKKYRSEISNQTASNNLNYLIDPTFTNVSRLFGLAFENEEDRTSFSEYHVPKVEIKDYNILNDQKPFFEIPVKNKEVTYEAIIKMSEDNYTTGNLLDFDYFSKHYKLIAIDLSKQIELENADLKQQINFFWKT